MHLKTPLILTFERYPFDVLYVFMLRLYRKKLYANYMAEQIYIYIYVPNIYIYIYIFL